MSTLRPRPVTTSVTSRAIALPMGPRASVAGRGASIVPGRYAARMPRTGASASEAPWPRSAGCARACRSPGPSSRPLGKAFSRSAPAWSKKPPAYASTSRRSVRTPPCSGCWQDASRPRAPDRRGARAAQTRVPSTPNPETTNLKSRRRQAPKAKGPGDLGQGLAQRALPLRIRQEIQAPPGPGLTPAGPHREGRFGWLHDFGVVPRGLRSGLKTLH